MCVCVCVRACVRACVRVCVCVLVPHEVKEKVRANDPAQRLYPITSHNCKSGAKRRLHHSSTQIYIISNLKKKIGLNRNIMFISKY